LFMVRRSGDCKCAGRWWEAPRMVAQSTFVRRICRIPSSGGPKSAGHMTAMARQLLDLMRPTSLYGSLMLQSALDGVLDHGRRNAAICSCPASLSRR